jgi:predicted ATP-dependent endonuclease of OLD family
MKISAFQIRNYRSIVDSGKCFLSPDHITALIGQNESGKTSILEALRSFYEGTITDDVLRSDLSFPEITCTFLLDGNKNLASYLELSSIPAEIKSVMETRQEVSVTRRWVNSTKNVIILADAEIAKYYNCLECNELSSADKIVASISLLTSQTEQASQEVQSVENEYDNYRKEFGRLQTKIEELHRIISRSKSPDTQTTARNDLSLAEEQLQITDLAIQEKYTILDDKKKLVQDLSAKLRICRQFTEHSALIKELTSNLMSANEQLRNTEYKLKLSRNDRECKIINKQLDQVRNSQFLLNDELKKAKNEISLNRKTADKILSGMDFTNAHAEAVMEYETEKGYSTPESLGMEIWKYIPQFEFFEDFSSLLPNKIDLDDLLNENIHSEGYKAARNFLSVAGLNADFFREENHRILKQKIENLNTEITVDFQDYWRQSVGKDDKIRINFELEHYDNSQPEKSGKPYLEFWIKDKQERLYPKQRSRGVRWFLSFYLELKATAKSNITDRIMLIDEPGLSLHARAQEDVLKVFEDLRQNLQIIYTTHSPNLIDLKKLYRIVAVQRDRDTDETSETIILDSHNLNEASPDTLSPIYSLMGTQLNERQFVFPKNNFIVEDSVTFHYLEAMTMLYGLETPVHYIPASGSEVVPSLANMLFGWKINFGLVLMDNAVNEGISDLLKNTTFFANGFVKRFIQIKGIGAVEDLFSTIDFKRFILKQRVGITVKNSEYIESNKLSRIIMVSDFHTKIKEENLNFNDFDEETRQNFEKLFLSIKNSAESE